MSTPKKQTSKTPHTTITLESLRTWNIRIAALQVLQGIIVLVLGAGHSVPITIGYLGLDSLQSQAQGHTVLAAATHQLFSINLQYLVALLFFIPAVVHYLLATKSRATYEKDIKKGINKIRWYGYSLSMGLMLVAVGLVCGVYDLASLVMIFVLGVVMNLLGLVMEMYNQGARKPNWWAYIIGSVAGFIPWVVFALYILGSHIYGNGVPVFVHWLYLTVFILFIALAVNTYLSFRKQGKWSDYLYGEQVYMGLSFVTTVVLAWQIFAGALRP